MDDLTPDRLKQVMLDAGFEIFGVEGTVIHLAERIRVHLMDAGVSVRAESGIEVRFKVRSQRSHYPSGTADELFARIREDMRASIAEHGFVEVEAATRKITDPVDEAHVLDVWHELTFARRVDAEGPMLELVRWALAQPKCIGTR